MPVSPPHIRYTPVRSWTACLYVNTGSQFFASKNCLLLFTCTHSLSTRKKRPYAKHRDDINRGTTLLPVHHEQALGLRNVQKRHSLLFSFQECSSRGKFDSCLNQRELSAHDSLSLMENKSLLTRSKPFIYTSSF